MGSGRISGLLISSVPMKTTHDFSSNHSHLEVLGCAFSLIHEVSVIVLDSHFNSWLKGVGVTAHSGMSSWRLGMMLSDCSSETLLVPALPPFGLRAAAPWCWEVFFEGSGFCQVVLLFLYKLNKNNLYCVLSFFFFKFWRWHNWVPDFLLLFFFPVFYVGADTSRHIYPYFAVWKYRVFFVVFLVCFWHVNVPTKRLNNHLRRLVEQTGKNFDVHSLYHVFSNIALNNFQSIYGCWNLTCEVTRD